LLSSGILSVQKKVWGEHFPVNG